MATKTKNTKTSKTKKPELVLPQYTRQDIDSILTNVMYASVCLAALLLTLTLFITALKH